MGIVQESYDAEEFIDPTPVMCRGRESLPVTRDSGSFTGEQLDAESPLTEEAARLLRKNQSSTEYEALINQRIQAAQRLKRGERGE